jgi:hypothetical protein
MTDLPKQAQIASEIREALKTGGEMTSSELTAFCTSALDSTDICRVIYDLKNTGLIGVSDVRAYMGKGKPVNFYRWIGPPDAVPEFGKKRKVKPTESIESIEDEAPVVAGPEPVAAEAPSIEVPCGGWHADGGWDASMQGPTTDEQREWAAKMADRNPVDPTTGTIHTRDEPDRVDPIEIALADLVDQADESILSFADAMLSDHPTWVRLRQMQDDCFQLLCDYRLTKTLEQS